MPPKKKQKKGPGIQWQWKNDEGGWVTYGDDDCDLLERAYKGEAKRSKIFQTTKLSFNKGFGTKYTFDFGKWTQLNEASKTTRRIRRLHDDSDDDDDDDDDEDDDDDAGHEWQWKDDNDLFVGFYDDDSALLEKAYRKAPASNFTTTKLSFNSEFGSTYVFNFKKMTQLNTDSDNVRKLRRVKKDTKGWDMTSYGIKSKTPTGAASGGCPSHWAKPKGSLDLVVVSPDSKEYKEALAPFFKTLTRKVKIIFLKRIQNYALYPFYCMTKAHIASRNGGNPKEATLFHGARVRANMDAIMNFGFDMRVAAQGSVGAGIYFAVNASYSDGGYALQNPDKSKEMFICKVALGSGVQGNSALRRPPPKDPKKPTGDLHDSVFNGAVMHVVFNNSQAYPEYLLKYQ